MRNGSARDRAAAIFYALAALLVLVGAVAGASVVLVALSVVLGIAALAALRGYPVDRTR